MLLLTTLSVLSSPLCPAGCERHVCGWEDWLPHVCVWVNGALYQYSPLLKWPAEAGHSLWRDADRGGEGVPRPPGCAGCLQRVLLAGLGWADGKWPGGQLAGRGTVLSPCPQCAPSSLLGRKTSVVCWGAQREGGTGVSGCPSTAQDVLFVFGWVANHWRMDMLTPCQPYNGDEALGCFSSPLSLLLKELHPNISLRILVQGSIRTLIFLCSSRQEIWKEWCDSYMAGYCWKIIWAVMLLGVSLLSTPLWQLISLFHFFPLSCSLFSLASSQLPS